MAKLGRILTVWFKASDEVITAVGKDMMYEYEKKNNLESVIIIKKEFEFVDQETHEHTKKEIKAVRHEYYFNSYKELINDSWFLDAVKDNKYPILNFKITDDHKDYFKRKTISDYMIPFSENSINILRCLDWYLDYEKQEYKLVNTKSKNAKNTYRKIWYWGDKI